VEAAIGIGDPAPDFALPNAAGKPVVLRKLLQLGPVVIAFYRAGGAPIAIYSCEPIKRFCPKSPGLALASSRSRRSCPTLRSQRPRGPR
jgi:hypothetical protein